MEINTSFLKRTLSPDPFLRRLHPEHQDESIPSPMSFSVRRLDSPSERRDHGTAVTPIPSVPSLIFHLHLELNLKH